jgi:2-oxoisovalerate dehydrogenase E1 component beta subunit
MEPKILYRSAGPLNQQLLFPLVPKLTHLYNTVEQVPIDDFELPLGQAEVLVPGSDLTLLTWGTPVYHCETALHLLENPPLALEKVVPASLRSSKIELIDLRSILPWDVETIVESVNRTGRLVIVHEAGLTAGVGAEISAEIQKRCFLKLNAPVKRVAGWE